MSGFTRDEVLKDRNFTSFTLGTNNPEVSYKYLISWGNLLWLYQRYFLFYGSSQAKLLKLLTMKEYFTLT